MLLSCLKYNIHARPKGYCQIKQTKATSRTIISPLIKSAIKFTILSGNFTAWVKQMLDIGFAR